MRSLIIILMASSCGSTLDQFSGGGPEPVPFGNFVNNGPVVAANDHGEMLIVWSENTDPEASADESQIFVSEFSDGRWRDPSSIQDALSGYERILRIDVALSDNGDAIVVWRTDDSLMMAERRNGSWLPATALASGGSIPTVVMGDDGDAIVAWTGEATCSAEHCCGVFRSEYTNGAWNHPQGTTDFVGLPGTELEGTLCGAEVSLALSDTGGAMMVWSQGPWGSSHIFRSVRTGGVWTDPTSVDDYISEDGFEALYPSVAMAGEDAVIAWGQRTEVSGVHFMMTERRGGSWSSVQQVSILSDSISIYQGPSIVMAPNGDTTIAWAQEEGLFLSEYRNGTWSHPADLDARIAATRGTDLNASVSSDGEITIVWSQSVNQTPRNFRSDYVNTVWHHPAETEFFTPLDTHANRPNVARSSTSVIAWLEADQFAIWEPTRLRRLWF